MVEVIAKSKIPKHFLNLIVFKRYIENIRPYKNIIIIILTNLLGFNKLNIRKFILPNIYKPKTKKSYKKNKLIL